jgi:Radical SAM superfamily/4Fe-4S single cluster domain
MLDSVVLSVTYKCPIRCRYCGVNAGPHRTEMMTLDFIQRILDEVDALGLRNLVVFTGGEPLLLGEDLFRAIQYATSHKFLTRVVTNAYWATSPEKARAMLSRLQTSGLTEINFSCDDFHQEFIPLERVQWANEAAAELGMPALLAVKGLKNTVIGIESLEKSFGVKLSMYCRGKQNPKNNVASFGVTVPVGPHSEDLPENELLFSPEEHCTGPCSSALDKIVITPRGELAICCGIGSDDFPESVIGSLHEKPLGKLLDEANNDLIVNWLALEGPYGIKRYLEERFPALRFNQRYVNLCHLCHDIFTRHDVRAALTESATHKIPSLSLGRAWLEAHRSEFFEQNGTEITK